MGLEKSVFFRNVALETLRECHARTSITKETYFQKVEEEEDDDDDDDNDNEDEEDVYPPGRAY